MPTVEMLPTDFLSHGSFHKTSVPVVLRNARTVLRAIIFGKISFLQAAYVYVVMKLFDT
jgi:hypothetical protein